MITDHTCRHTLAFIAGHPGSMGGHRTGRDTPAFAGAIRAGFTQIAHLVTGTAIQGIRLDVDFTAVPKAVVAVRIAGSTGFHAAYAACTLAFGNIRTAAHNSAALAIFRINIQIFTIRIACRSAIGIICRTLIGT